MENENMAESTTEEANAPLAPEANAPQDTQLVAVDDGRTTCSSEHAEGEDEAFSSLDPASLTISKIEREIEILNTTLAIIECEIETIYTHISTSQHLSGDRLLSLIRKVCRLWCDRACYTSELEYCENLKKDKEMNVV